MGLRFWKRQPKPPTGPYTGRLGWDSEQEFHTDASGEHFVVTDDAGKTWRYAEAGDTSHNFRYQKQTLEVVSTGVKLAELTYEHGYAKAATLVDPHHWTVLEHDEHFPGLKFSPDNVAAVETGHTEAYA